jgi:hypothetical protein
MINVSKQSKLATIECAICSAWLVRGFSAGGAGRAGARLDHDRRVTLAKRRAAESMSTRALVSSYGSRTSMDTASNPLPSALRQRSARRSASRVTGRSSIQIGECNSAPAPGAPELDGEGSESHNRRSQRNVGLTQSSTDDLCFAAYSARRPIRLAVEHPRLGAAAALAR